MNARTIVALMLFVASWAIAPYYHKWVGHPDEAAWVQLWMALPGLLGVIMCIINLKVKSPYLLLGTYVVLLIHLVIGLGFHPR